MQYKTALHGVFIAATALVGALLLAQGQAATPGAEAAGVLAGSVAETMNSGGYTYLLVDDGQTKQWVATTVVEVKVGSKVEVPAGVPMKNFFSPTLKRSFPEIRFVGSVTIDGQKQGAAGMPAGHPNLNAMAPTGEEAGFTGKVLETTNSGGYVFVRVQGPHKSLWAATQPCQVTVGDNVSLPPGEVMQQFRSASLNRTFEEILFVEHLDNLTLRGGTLPLTASGAKAALPPGHPKLKETAPLSGPDVQIAQPAGGHTVAEVFAQRQQLAGQTLTIKGRVMKFTPGIMGRNWMHLRDGTGTAGNNDLTVTTTDLAKVGDVVTMRGTLVIDQDFGGGYTYSALLEKAAVQKN